MTRTIGVRLPDSNISGYHAVWRDFSLVITHFRVCRISQIPLVYKREMCHIQKIFYCSRPAGVIVIGATMHFMKRSIIPLRKSGYIFYRVAECNPYPIILFLRLVDCHSCFGGRYLVWMSRKANASTFLVVRPTMICTNERLLFYSAQRK